jgi:NAD(P)-dependent dehydrogenase (short-subunit alcohol dehydrogenase family)
VIVSRTSARANSARSDVGSNAVAVLGDVAAPDGARRIVDEALNACGQIDILVNAAGVMRRGAIEDTSDDDFYEIMRVNTFGVWAMCRAIVPAMHRNGGSIINIASAAGMVGYDKRAAYGTSKGAVIQLTRCLAVEFARHHIRVNAVSPGPFRTGMSCDRATTPQMAGLLAHRVPLGRMAEPDEIGGSVTFLAGPASSFVTGVILPVDGGWTAG